MRVNSHELRGLSFVTVPRWQIRSSFLTERSAGNDRLGDAVKKMGRDGGIRVLNIVLQKWFQAKVIFAVSNFKVTRPPT